MFKALLLDRGDAGGAGAFTAGVVMLDENRLPGWEQADVLVQPLFSTLNYKDALALTNRSPVVRSWPMVPGIDGAGVVLESRHPDWKPGDHFIHNGWGVGETHWGCLAERAQLKGDWLVPLPAAFGVREAMAIGTAGYTAALCLLALEQHGLAPGAGDVLVTGATGGVGSIAIALLARAGHRVVAASGKADAQGYLRRLGAAAVIDRAELSAPGKPLQKERWAAAIDTLGSQPLASVLAQTRYGGVVAACGLAAGGDLPTTVMPFILRGVTLAGVDSVMAPRARRLEAWDRLARDLDLQLLASMTEEIGLAEAPARAQDLMRGTHRGRIVVRIAD